MKVRRCPLCHRANSASEWQCHCGYEFGQAPEKALELLYSQGRNVKIGLALLLAADAAAFVALALALSPVLSGILCGFLALQTIRLIRKLMITRESIRQLEPRTLPKAQLRRG